jgi:hypothetical protein
MDHQLFELKISGPMICSGNCNMLEQARCLIVKVGLDAVNGAIPLVLDSSLDSREVMYQEESNC